MSPFHITQTKRVHDGRVVKLRIDTLDVGGGRTVQREIVEHPGAIVVAALDEEGRVLMVRQYRHAAGETLLELPAGTREPGEDVLSTAQRELQEETGFSAADMRPAGGFFSAPGFCEEYLHLFIARKLVPQRLQGDEDEEIELEAVPLDEARRLILSGGIKDAKTIAGLYVLELTLRGGV